MKHRSKEEWKNLLHEQKESGVSQSEFCRERGIAIASFQLQKKKERIELVLPYVELPTPKVQSEASAREAALEIPGGVTLRVRW